MDAEIYNDKLLFIAPNSNIKNLMQEALEHNRIKFLIKSKILYGEDRDDVNFRDVNSLCTIPHYTTHTLLNIYWDDMTLKGDISLHGNSRHYDNIKKSMEYTDIGWFLPRLICKVEDNTIQSIFIITFDYASPMVITSISHLSDRCRNLIARLQYGILM